MNFLLLLALVLPAQDDPLQNLQHKDPAVRRAGVEVIRAKKMFNGIPR